MINLFSILPQYALVAIISFFSTNVTIALLGIIIVVKTIPTIMVASQFDENRISRFDKRYK
ncbi:hypothetical protein IJZ97_01430 [bacterium]|nr:hypothetical protein [bacterium]